MKELQLNWEEIPALRPGWQLGMAGMATGEEVPVSVVDLFKFWR